MTTDCERLRRQHESLLKEVREWVARADHVMDLAAVDDTCQADIEAWQLIHAIHESNLYLWLKRENES